MENDVEIEPLTQSERAALQEIITDWVSEGFQDARWSPIHAALPEIKRKLGL